MEHLRGIPVFDGWRRSLVPNRLDAVWVTEKDFSEAQTHPHFWMAATLASTWALLKGQRS